MTDIFNTVVASVTLGVITDWTLIISIVVVAVSALIVVGVAFYILQQGIQRDKEEIRQRENALRQSYDLQISNEADLTEQLNDLQKGNILKALRGITEDISHSLTIPLECTRANMSIVDNQGRIRIILNTYREEVGEEPTNSMPEYYAGLGRFIEDGEPNIAILRKDKAALSGKDLSPKWIISVPLSIGGKSGRPFWVLNVEGMVEKKEEQLEGILANSDLFHYSLLVAYILADRTHSGM